MEVRLMKIIITRLVLFSKEYFVASIHLMMFQNNGKTVGMENKPDEGNIIGGHEVKPKSYPYQVGLCELEPYNLFNIPYVTNIFCGGSIIGRKYVITAAHCTVPKADEKIYVVAGTVGGLFLDDTVQIREVERVINHEEYIRPTVTNDISLIVINETFILNEYVRIIHLPKHQPTANTWCVVSGWGVTIPTRAGPTSVSLLATNVLIENDSFCRKFDLCFASDLKICSGSVIGHSACAGDSGGPVACNSELQGVVSYSQSINSSVCGRGGLDIFTKVYSYKSWIASNLIEINRMLSLEKNNASTVVQKSMVSFISLTLINIYLNNFFFNLREMNNLSL